MHNVCSLAEHAYRSRMNLDGVGTACTPKIKLKPAAPWNCPGVHLESMKPAGRLGSQHQQKLVIQTGTHSLNTHTYTL